MLSPPLGRRIEPEAVKFRVKVLGSGIRASGSITKGPSKGYIGLECRV